MTELQLYKFIEDTGSMTSYDGEHAIMWVYHFNIGDLVELLGKRWLEDGGIEVRLQEQFIAIDMTDICQENSININEVFK